MDATNSVSRKRLAPDSFSTSPTRHAPYDRLKSVSLSLSAQKHLELDERVMTDGTLKRIPKEPERCTCGDLSLVLSAIVRHATPECNLNQGYSNPGLGGDLIEGNDAFRKAVQDAWGKGEFAEVRELEILQSYRPSAAATTSTERSLSTAFHDTFYARNALVAFTRYLTANCKQFNSGAPSISSAYCGKYCSVVQSSGTGKSRLLSELGKSGVMVIHINLQDRSGTENYPLCDDIAAILLEPPPGLERKQYEARCSAFFIALFRVFRLRLMEIMTQEGSWESASTKWQALFGASDGPFRRDFFHAVRIEFDAVVQELNAVLTEPAFIGGYAMINAFVGLLESCGELLCDQTHEPKVVIAIDEASILGKESNGFKPSDVICTAISLFSNRMHCAVWFVFVSTEFRVADLTIPTKIRPSLRVCWGGEALFQPFTELGWDQLAPPLDEIHMDQIDTFDHIARFGRPLWFASKEYFRGVVEEVVRLAQIKLLNAKYYSQTEHQALALLSQRFALDIVFGHPQAAKHVEEAVASHLRICITTTEDRSWMVTTYPSEPLLSHAAADVMWRPFVMRDALRHLKKNLESGMIDKGENGELVSRLLLLLAKDSCARRLDHLGLKRLRYCCPIPVGEWLEELFGPNVWPKVEAERQAAKEAFASATINFSHWVSMSESVIPTSDDVEVVETEEWLKRNFVRTSALQCVHEERFFNQVIPTYDPTSSSFSSICISVKLDNTSSNGDKNSVESPTNYMDTGRPWITITLDLGVSTEIRATYSPKSVTGTHQCLRIYAGGLDSSTFTFLKDSSDLEVAMKGIRNIAIRPPAHLNSTLSMMREQNSIGTSRRPIHMRWGETRTEEV